MDDGLSAPAGTKARRNVGLCVAAALLGTAGAGFAQAPSPPAPMAAAAPSPVFAIKGFKVTGDNPLGDGETSRVLAPFLRANASIETLQQATAALEKALRDRGFGLHRVSLPPQEVGEMVTLHIVSFTVGKVDIEGGGLYDNANIRSTVPELREGGTPNFKKLAVQTAIANENPNKQIQVGIRESDQPDRIDATINVREQRPWNLSLGWANSGSKSSGRDRFTVSGGHTNLFNRDHQFIGAYTTSFEKPQDVKQLGLSYKVPLYELGSVVSASFTRSDVVGDFGSFSSTGAGHTFGASYILYLPPDGGRRSFVALGIEDKLFEATRINDIVVPGTFDRRSRPLVLGYAARTESDAAFWGYHLDLAVNTGSGNHNDLASYRSEDPRIDTVRWKALRGGASYLAPLTGGWTWSARTTFQYSPDALISGEQFGLGGVSSVRGTSIERPISGDQGLSASLEVTTPELAQGLRLLGFVDAGWLSNNRSTATKPSSDSIASAGLGLRYLRGNFSVGADWGRLIDGSKVPQTLNAGSPQKGDDKLYINLSVRF
jgi:hemolysin activation/secretion protein